MADRYNQALLGFEATSEDGRCKVGTVWRLFELQDSGSPKYRNPHIPKPTIKATRVDCWLVTSRRLRFEEAGGIDEVQCHVGEVS